MTNAAKQRVMIVGTEGNPDYLVMAKDQGFILGIKPLLLISMDQTQFGFRLRMQKDEDAKTDIENTSGDLAIMQSVFSDVPWSKRSSTRFSTVLLNDISYGVEFLDKIKGEVNEGFVKLFGEIVEKIAPVIVEDESDVIKFLTERYETIIEDVRQAYAQHKDGDNTPSKNDDVADVIAFPQKDDTDDI